MTPKLGARLYPPPRLTGIWGGECLGLSISFINLGLLPTWRVLGTGTVILHYWGWSGLQLCSAAEDPVRNLLGQVGAAGGRPDRPENTTL